MNETPHKEQAGLPLDHAEELVDKTLFRLAGFAARTAALAREEAEDIWAEAKELRKSHR
jgi:hypothetical protein